MQCLCYGCVYMWRGCVCVVWGMLWCSVSRVVGSVSVVVGMCMSLCGGACVAALCIRGAGCLYCGVVHVCVAGRVLWCSVYLWCRVCVCCGLCIHVVMLCGGVCCGAESPQRWVCVSCVGLCIHMPPTPTHNTVTCTHSPPQHTHTWHHDTCSATHMLQRCVCCVCVMVLCVCRAGCVCCGGLCVHVAVQCVWRGVRCGALYPRCWVCPCCGGLCIYAAVL